MVKCFGCNQEWDNAAETPLVFADRHSDKVFGLCPTCRRHIAIGRAVEGMRSEQALMRLDKWAFDPEIGSLEAQWNHADTPLEALKGKKT